MLRKTNTQYFRNLCSPRWAKLIFKSKFKVNFPLQIPTCFRFQHVWIISQWIKLLDKIPVIPRMRFRNHFLMLILLNNILRQSFKDCSMFERDCRLVHLITLKFTGKKSNGIFLKIYFPSTELLSCVRFYHFPQLFKMLYMVKLSDNAFSVK